MARAISDEELSLKKRARRRLIGAIILVTLVVVVLPMVLDSEPKSDNQDINIRIPSTDSGPYTPKVAPTIPPAPPASKSEPAPAPKTDLKPGPVAAVPPEAAAKPDPAPKPEPVAKSAPAVKPAAQKASKPAAERAAAASYVVQVVALSDADKAKALERKISAAGLKAYTEVVKTEKGDVTRVRVGPFPSREAADGALGKLKSMSLDGKIVTVK